MIDLVLHLGYLMPEDRIFMFYLGGLVSFFVRGRGQAGQLLLLGTTRGILRD